MALLQQQEKADLLFCCQRMSERLQSLSEAPALNYAERSLEGKHLSQPSVTLSFAKSLARFPSSLKRDGSITMCCNRHHKRSVRRFATRGNVGDNG